MKYYVKKSIDKMIQKEKVYKKIDFEKDICKEKSDLYFINEDGELQFICGAPKSLLDYNGYFFNDSEDCRTRSNLEFKPVEIFYEDTKAYHSRYIFDNLVEKYDVIYFEFNNSSLEQNESFNLYLFDKLYLEANKKIKITKNMLKNGQFFQLSLNSNIALYRYYLNKEGFSHVDYNKDINITTNNKYILDLSKRKMFINNTPIGNFTNLDFKNALNNICLICIYNSPKEKLINIKQEKLIIGKRKGIIYLHPIKPKQDVKLKVICKGDLKIEVYSYKEKKWLELSKSYVLTVEDTIFIRLHLNIFDKLNEIILEYL